MIFNNEIDLLELRLMEIGDLVNRVVVVESTKTFSGQPKPLWLEHFKHRLNRWGNKLVVIVDDPEDCTVPNVEWSQRREIFRGVENVEMTDILLLSDVDEIPSREVLQLIRKTPPARPVVLLQHLYYYSVNWKQACAWNGTMAFPRGLGRLDFQAIRNQRNMVPPLTRGGFHFSWFGGGEDISYSLRCHTVADDAARYGSKVTVPDPEDVGFLDECVRTGADMFRRPDAYAQKTWVEVRPGDTHPHAITQWLKEHPKYESVAPDLRCAT